MNTPKIPTPGEQIKAQHIADIIRWVQSLAPHGDGKTVGVSRTAGGSVLTSMASGDNAYYCTLQSQINGYLFQGEVYQNFSADVYVEENAKIIIGNYYPTLGWDLAITLELPSLPFLTFSKYWDAFTLGGTNYPAGDYWTILLDSWR
jgi:hypothetical protein